jgi:hypothetical protein
VHTRARGGALAERRFAADSAARTDLPGRARAYGQHDALDVCTRTPAGSRRDCARRDRHRATVHGSRRCGPRQAVGPFCPYFSKAVTNASCSARLHGPTWRPEAAARSAHAAGWSVRAVRVRVAGHTSCAGADTAALARFCAQRGRPTVRFGTGPPRAGWSWFGRRPGQAALAHGTTGAKARQAHACTDAHVCERSRPYGGAVTAHE